MTIVTVNFPKTKILFSRPNVVNVDEDYNSFRNYFGNKRGTLEVYKRQCARGRGLCCINCFKRSPPLFVSYFHTRRHIPCLEIQALSLYMIQINHQP